MYVRTNVHPRNST